MNPALIKAIGEIAGAVKECSRVLGVWLASRDKRRMQAALFSARQYVFVNEKNGEYEDLPEKKREKYLVHFRKKIFIKI